MLSLGKMLKQPFLLLFALSLACVGLDANAGIRPAKKPVRGLKPIRSLPAFLHSVSLEEASEAPSDEALQDPAPPDTPATSLDTPWLHTEGNRILTEDGTLFMGRGANVQDTRGCNACTTRPPNPDEVIRRIDELTDNWGANFLRLTLESYGTPSVLTDPSYLADIERIVEHVGTKPGVYVMVSLWHDPTFSASGWPTASTHPVWEQLAMTFANSPHVLFGLVNEPQNNFDGAQDAAVWQAMNDTVRAIRDTEAAVGARKHIISVQGTGGWARRIGYYVDHPITAGGGENIVYETHVYDPATAFQNMFVTPAQSIPVVIGEFGPAAGMSMTDARRLMEIAEEQKIPYLAWTFHMRCPPNLIEDYSNGGCGEDMPLEPTAWGDLLKAFLNAGS